MSVSAITIKHFPAGTKSRNSDWPIIQEWVASRPHLKKYWSRHFNRTQIHSFHGTRQLTRLLAMYASRTACSRCTSQLRLAAAQRLGARAWYASLADAADVSQSSSTAATENHASRRPKQARKPFNKAKDPALALFNDVVSPASSQQDAVTAKPALGELEIAGKVAELVRRDDMSLEQRYKVFDKDIWPHIRQMSGRLPREVYTSVATFLGLVRQAMVKKDTHIDHVEFSKKLAAIGRTGLDVRNDLILSVCDKVTTELDKESPSEADVSKMLDELVGLWKHVTQLKRPSQAGKELRFAVPSVKEVLRDIDRHKHSEMRLARIHPMSKRLASIFLQHTPEQAKELMPGLLATITILADPRIPDAAAVRQEAAPLLHLVSIVLNRQRPEQGFFHSVFESKSLVPQSVRSKLMAYVQINWDRTLGVLLEKDANWRTGLEAMADPEIKSTIKIVTFHKQLRAAYLARHTGAVMAIWQDLLENMQKYPDLAKQIRGDAKFLDFWVFVWCAIRRPVKMQETIELMKRLKIEPTIKTYTAMMHGWKMCKDATKIEILWQQLRKGGVRLDAVIWTERISSLIEVGRPQEGIKALAEMVDTWKQAIKDNRRDEAVKPTIEVVNAAFKGLIITDPLAANQVLEWAGREGFQPNIRTYNILLRESFRSGHPDDVQGLLRSMKDQNIDPDAATFTIILEEVLSTMEDASPAEQVAAVKQILKDIQTAGLKPNMETYAKMLYAIVSLPNGSDQAIAAIQAHMRGNNFKITPHMVTILIERALALSPPDIAAVRSLLQEHNIRHVDQGDQTLWERVMSAFAIAGEKEHAMRVFNDMASAGRPVTSLPCLTDLLKMLIAQRDGVGAKRVVDVVLGYKMKSGEDVGGRYWKHHFWHVAKEQRLVSAKQAPHLFGG